MFLLLSALAGAALAHEYIHKGSFDNEGEPKSLFGLELPTVGIGVGIATLFLAPMIGLPAIVATLGAGVAAGSYIAKRTIGRTKENVDAFIEDQGDQSGGVDGNWSNYLPIAA